MFWGRFKKKKVQTLQMESIRTCWLRKIKLNEILTPQKGFSVKQLAGLKERKVAGSEYFGDLF